MAMYDGDNTYNGKPLFRGAIMQSGSLLPMETITDSRPQKLYHHFADAAGCSNLGDSDTMTCLRGKSTSTLSAAMNSWGLADGFGVMDMFITWSPRADGNILRDIPYKLVDAGKFAKVPYIIGNQNDEATLFAALLSWSSWSESQVQSLAQNLLFKSTESQRSQLLSLYPQDPSQGAPWGTGLLYSLGLGIQFKRIAGLLTDLLYHANRRRLLWSDNSIPRWNYLSKALSGLPYLGTTHANDLIWQWFLDLGPYRAYQEYFIAFANHLDPNVGVSLSNWPKYTNSDKKTLEIGFGTLGTTTDDFRNNKIQWMIDNPEAIAL